MRLLQFGLLLVLFSGLSLIFLNINRFSNPGNLSLYRKQFFLFISYAVRFHSIRKFTSFFGFGSSWSGEAVEWRRGCVTSSAIWISPMRGQCFFSFHFTYYLKQRSHFYLLISLFLDLYTLFCFLLVRIEKEFYHDFEGVVDCIIKSKVSQWIPW